MFETYLSYHKDIWIAATDYCICYAQVEILYKLYKLQLKLQAPLFSVKQCILMNLYFKIHKISISDLHE